MIALQTLETALRLKAGVIWVTTSEEVRAEAHITRTCESLGYEVSVWSVSEGLRRSDDEGTSTARTTANAAPDDALRTIRKIKTRTVVIMRDLGQWAAQPITARLLRDALRSLPTRPSEQSVQIVVVDPSDPPADISPFLIDWPLPDRAEIGTLLDQMLDLAPDSAREEVTSNGHRDALIDAALGLTSDQISIALTQSLVERRRFDPAAVIAQKRAVIRGSGLEWHEPDARGMDGIGGLGELKAWLCRRRAGLGGAGAQWGLPVPKGVLLVGVPGCGKSLAAKCTAAAWGVPLLRLDVGALFSKWVGESEQTVRRALAVAETVAPAVLWIDEIEKGGLSASGGDGGTGARVFATLLTWMQERSASVFAVATANDVSALPPELLRAGRWDETFFVDLPSDNERTEIAEIMARRYPHCGEVDPAVVAEGSMDYTGAEIEVAYRGAIYRAYEDGKRDVRTRDVICELARIVPLVRSMAEKIEALRSWAGSRARLASDRATNTGPRVRTVEL